MRSLSNVIDAMPSRVSVTWAGDSVTVMLNRPERGNALDPATVEALLVAVELAAARGCSLMTLGGAGKNFCTGFDLDDLDAISDGDLLLRFVRIETLLQALHHAPFPILCLAQGSSFGAGVDILCACSYRVADAGARFRMPGWRFGLALGTRRLTSRIGGARARAVLRDAAEISANEALEWGLLTGIAPQAEWPTQQQATAERWKSLDPAARAHLLRLTTTDTRTADIADLVVSASRSGIKSRIAAYRAERLPRKASDERAKEGKR